MKPLKYGAKWIFNEHTQFDNHLRWSSLRAVEWNNWPGWLSQAVVPVLLLILPVWKVLVGIYLANACWSLIRYRGVSIFLADLGCLFTYFLKWPVTIAMGIWFLWHGRFTNALLCGLWFPLSGFIIFILNFPGQVDRIGRMQRMFMAALGYEWDERWQRYSDVSILLRNYCNAIESLKSL